jgi:hypothetical protein
MILLSIFIYIYFWTYFFYKSLKRIRITPYGI